MTSISPNQSFGYDTHGNMTTRTDATGSYSQTYDAENRLISVNKSGVGLTTFGYDANGQRTTTRTPDGTLTYTPFPGYEQSYPTAKQDTFPTNAANWNLESGGNWTWNASQFYVSSDTSNNALTTHNTATLGSNGVIVASIRANSDENGYLVFDYQDASNYKYIGLDAQADRWVFGQRVSNTNNNLYILNQTVNGNQWYDVKVVLSGNTARLYVNGAYKAQYNYSATFTGGKVGLRAVNAATYFDNFLVSSAEISRSTYAIAGQVIATRISGDPISSNNGLFYLFSDHLGSTSVLATSTGSRVPGSRATYYPFGSPRTAPTQTITDRNFTGQKENMELGLIYYNARYYVPGIARFLTPDTIIPNPANPQSFNRYSYVFNSPTRFTDPTGHRTCTVQEVAAGDETCDQNIARPNPLPNFSACDDQWCINDDGPGNLPIGNWNPEDASLRIARTQTVMDWLADYQGPNWWGGPPGSMPDLAHLVAWLLYQEGSILQYEDQQLMARIMLFVLGYQRGEITAENLSNYTAFFDPNGDNRFSMADWQELVLLQNPDGSEINLDYYLELVTDTMEHYTPPPAGVLYWWDQTEAPNTDPNNVYQSTTTLTGRRFYFGTLNQRNESGF